MYRLDEKKDFEILAKERGLTNEKIDMLTTRVVELNI